MALGDVSVVGATKGGREAENVGGLARSCDRRVRAAVADHDHRVAVPLAERRLERVGEARSRPLAHHKPIGDDEQFLDLREIRFGGVEIVEVMYRTVSDHAHESLGAQVLDDPRVHQLGDRKSVV